MRKLLFIFLIFVPLFVVNAQEGIIEINNTEIKTPDVYNFGEVSSAVYVKYIIKNNRNTAVNVSEIVTPPGFFANISDMTIGKGKKVILYVGLDPSFVEEKGEFNEQIIIKTNLIKDIVVKVTGKIIE